MFFKNDYDWNKQGDGLFEKDLNDTFCLQGDSTIFSLGGYFEFFLNDYVWNKQRNGLFEKDLSDTCLEGDVQVSKIRWAECLDKIGSYQGSTLYNKYYDA